MDNLLHDDQLNRTWNSLVETLEAAKHIDLNIFVTAVEEQKNAQWVVAEIEHLCTGKLHPIMLSAEAIFAIQRIILQDNFAELNPVGVVLLGCATVWWISGPNRDTFYEKVANKPILGILRILSKLDSSALSCLIKYFSALATFRSRQQFLGEMELTVFLRLGIVSALSVELGRAAKTLSVAAEEEVKKYASFSSMHHPWSIFDLDFNFTAQDVNMTIKVALEECIISNVSSLALLTPLLVRTAMLGASPGSNNS